MDVPLTPTHAAVDHLQLPTALDLPIPPPFSQIGPVSALSAMDVPLSPPLATSVSTSGKSLFFPLRVQSNNFSEMLMDSPPTHNDGSIGPYNEHSFDIELFESGSDGEVEELGESSADDEVDELDESSELDVH
jgi:hypothetical protein